MPKYEQYTKDYQKTPKGRFVTQKASATRRGIPWELSFEDWWKIWEKSGKWEMRGNRAGQFCMARIGDEGCYSKDNIEIKLLEANSREIKKNKKTKKLKEEYWTSGEAVFQGGWKKCQPLEMFGYPSFLRQGLQH